MPVKGIEPAFDSKTASTRGEDSADMLAGVVAPEREMRLRRGCGKDMEDGELITSCSEMRLWVGNIKNLKGRTIRLDELSI